MIPVTAERMGECAVCGKEVEFTPNYCYGCNFVVCPDVKHWENLDIGRGVHHVLDDHKPAKKEKVRRGAEGRKAGQPKKRTRKPR